MIEQMFDIAASLETVRVVLDEWKSEDLALRPMQALADDLVELRRVMDLLELEWSRRLSAFTSARGHDLEGHSSPTAFLTHRCRMSAAHAQRSVAMANRLPAVSFVEKAVEGGDLSLDQARVFTNLPDHLSRDLARDEVTLVNAAAQLTVSDTRRLIEYWRSAVDGPGTDTTVELMAQRRYLFGARTFEGMVKIDGLLDPIAGDLVLTALEAATAPPGEGDLRSARQRRADALADLARSFLDSGEARGSEKPHVIVLTDLDALQGHGGGTHESGRGHVLTPEQVRQYACDCTISRIIFGPGCEPVDIGRASRVVPASMRRALVARDRHCTHPTCDRLARWCDAHHVRHWADGGPTSLSNLRLLCRYHHALEHRASRNPPDG